MILKHLIIIALFIICPLKAFSQPSYVPDEWMSSGTTVRVTSTSNNVGIGTTTSTEKLEVNGTVKASALTTGAGTGSISSTQGINFDSNEDGVPEMVILTGGNVAIGTSTPTAKLDVSGKAKADGVALKPSVTYTVCSASTIGNDTCDYLTDGTADNVQINAALVAGAGGHVKVMEGSYSISDVVLVPSNTTLEIAKGATITIPNSYTPTTTYTVNSRVIKALITNSDHSTGNTNVHITGLGRITAEGTTQSQATTWAAVYLHKCTYSYIGGLTIDNLLYTITVENDERQFGVFFTETDDSVIDNLKVSYTGDDPITIRRSSRRNIIMNSITHSSKFGHCYQIAGGTAGSIFGTNGNNTEYNILANNICKGTTNQLWSGSGIATHHAVNTSVFGNYIENTGSGLLILGDVYGNIYDNNRIVDPETYGVYVNAESSGAPTIGMDNNSFSNTRITMKADTEYGVYVNSGTVDISGLTFAGGYIAGANGDAQNGFYFLTSGEDMRDISVTNFTIRDIGNTAIRFEAATGDIINNSIVTNNTLIDNGVGILTTATGGTIKDFVINSNQINSDRNVAATADSARGLRLNYLTESVITGNRVDTLGIAVSETQTADYNFFSNNNNVGSGTTSVQTVGVNTIDRDGASSNPWIDGGSNIYLSTSTDNVGIGTSIPSYRLNIKGDQTSQIRATNTTTSSIFQGGTISLSSDDGAALDVGHRLGSYQFHGAVNEVSGLNIGASISAISAESYSPTNVGTNLVFNTVPIGSNGTTEKLRIESLGNVGIGTFTIPAKLVVQNTVVSEGIVQFNDDINDPSPFFINSLGNVGIGTDNPRGSLTILSGNVGIGTWSPTAKFEIIGGGIKAVGIGTSVPMPLCRKADGTFGTYTGATWNGTCN